MRMLNDGLHDNAFADPRSRMLKPLTITPIHVRNVASGKKSTLAVFVKTSTLLNMHSHHHLDEGR